MKQRFFILGGEYWWLYMFAVSHADVEYTLWHPRSVSSALNPSHISLAGRHAKAHGQHVLSWCLMSPLLWRGRDLKTMWLDLRRDLWYLSRKPNLLGDELVKQSCVSDIHPSCSNSLWKLHRTSFAQVRWYRCRWLYIPGTVNPCKTCISAWCQRAYLMHLNGMQGAVTKHSYLTSWEWELVGGLESLTAHISLNSKDVMASGPSLGSVTILRHRHRMQPVKLLHFKEKRDFVSHHMSRFVLKQLPKC